MKGNRFFVPLAILIFLIVACQSKKELEFQQYYIQGQVFYTKHCSNCHQKDGKGLGLLYPPVDRSDYVDQNFQDVLCIIRNGKSTPTIVNGKTYEQPMKGIPGLTDLDIAEIATYLYNTWDRKRGIVDVNEVTDKMANCE